MSRTVRFDEIGDPSVLRLEEVPDLVPGPGEVLIRTRALGLNRAEALFRSGRYAISPVLPSGIGYEAAGLVEAVGSGVLHVAAGDAVSVVPAFAMTDYGAHGELVVVPAHAVVAHPSHLSFAEAASVWMMFITAYGALIEVAGLRAGDTVLIPAASSSVGLAAIQIARMTGARAIALTRTSAKRQRLLEAGADAVIATTEEDVVTRIRELTDGEGARVIFDPVGGPALADLIAITPHGGVIVVYGTLDSEPVPLDTHAVLFKELTIRGYLIFQTTLDDERRRQAVEFIGNGLTKGELTPVIDRTFPLEAIAEAHHYLEASGQIGKIVVTVGNR
jgi:NADPH:quinone reductase-like Zn-dependent oxidoreductase